MSTENDLLISKFLDENLSAAEWRSFDRELASNPEFAGRLREVAIQHALLFKLSKSYQLTQREKRKAAEGAASSAILPRIKTGRLATMRVVDKPRFKKNQPDNTPKKFNWLWLAGVASVLLIAGVVFWPKKAASELPRLADLTHAGANAELQRKGRVIALELPARIMAGDTLLAGNTAATLEYADGTQVVFAPKSVVTFESDAAPDVGKLIKLSQGSLKADVAKQPNGHPMVIETKHAIVHVLGTTLKVWSDPSEMMLQTITGNVKVTRSSDGAQVQVGSGEYAVANPQVPLQSRKLDLRLDQELLSYWPMNEATGEKAADKAGRNPPLVLQSVSWTQGVHGSALRFENSDSSTDLGTASALNFPSAQDFSISFWFKPGTHSGSVMTLSSGTIPVLSLEVAARGSSEGSLRLEARTQAQSQAVRAETENFLLSEWHHFTLTRNRDGRIELYLDGSRQSNGACMAPGLLSSTSRWLGKGPGSVAGFAGTLDELRVYSRALNTPEIKELASRVSDAVQEK